MSWAWAARPSDPRMSTAPLEQPNSVGQVAPITASSEERGTGLELPPGTSRCYCTLVTSDSFVTGATVLLYSLLKTGTQFDVVVLVTPAISGYNREKIQKVVRPPGCAAKIHVVTVKPIENPSASKDVHVKGWINAGYTKLHIWNLQSYQKVVYIDADALVLRNVDSLFDRPNFSAAPDVFPPTKFNAGVLVIEPDAEVFRDMLAKVDSLWSHDGGDTGFLNSYFPDWYQLPASNRLPFSFNAQRTMHWLTFSKQPGYWKSIGPISILHFSSTPKPWLSPKKKGELEIIWWQYFMESVTPPNMSSLFSQLTQKAT